MVVTNKQIVAGELWTQRNDHFTPPIFNPTTNEQLILMQKINENFTGGTILNLDLNKYQMPNMINNIKKR
jgi:hypothetical protein